MNGHWAGKHVLITGASSGLGRALALEAAARGARVGVMARREPLLRELVDQLTAAGRTAAWAVADVERLDEVQAAVSSLEQSLGPCDVAIGNAGVYRLTHGVAYDAKRASHVFSTNVVGVSNLLGAVLPGMVARRRGQVCAVSSLGALLALPGGGAYSASKAALATLLKSVRLDVEPRGVQVTTVFPGFIDTPLITDYERNFLRGVMNPPDAARRILNAIERRKREVYFPFGLWLQCWIASLLPWPIYRLVMRTVKPLEET